MNEVMQREFTKEEVEEALKWIGPLKSPDPDGFRVYFYQTYWNIVGEAVCKVISSPILMA